MAKEKKQSLAITVTLTAESMNYVTKAAADENRSISNTIDTLIKEVREARIEKVK